MNTEIQPRLRVASYNIRKARGLDGRRDPLRALQVISGLGAHVIALQEADKRLGPRPAAVPHELIERETDYRVVPLAVSEVSIGWHGNAILVHKDLPHSAPRRIGLPGLEPRGAVAVRIGLPRPVTVAGVHLGLTRRHRLQQLAVLREHLAGDDEDVVIMGDFNEWSASRGLEPLEGAFEVHSPGRTFHARRPLAGLDRIALSQGLTLRDAGVEEGPLARITSDHLPVWADLECRAVSA